MAESSFRQSLQGFRWAQGVTDDSQPTTEQSPFARFTSALSSGIPLRSSERSNEEEAYFALSRWERFVGFLLCIAGAAACFVVSFLIGLPMLAIKPRKFAVAFSLGSSDESPAHRNPLVACRFGVLQGPVAHLKHIFSAERLPFTAAYFGSLILTLIFALKHSYLGTLVCGAIQCVALVSYFVSYFPGGFQTLSYGSRMAMRGAGSLLPV
ncbi:protein transport protein sft2 [Rhodotorula mucilaginosa]|uniref:Protein transport protein SFT2 n=1 Tax=Rhodotorula mucilaginosa TaxID=5537 RepID=A0A9P6VVP4_RHOMI|nr:protein transport protein sft2 [Rhodotorula mucilaginosa]